MAKDKNDLELLNRIAKGGDITSDDTGKKGSNNSGAITTLTEGTTALSFELGSDNKDKK